MKAKKLKSLTDWDWTTVVASWRYYEHRHTIASAMFPHELVRRYWSADYSDDDRMRIAMQRAGISCDQFAAETASCA